MGWIFYSIFFNYRSFQKRVILSLLQNNTRREEKDNYNSNSISHQKIRLYDVINTSAAFLTYMKKEREKS